MRSRLNIVTSDSEQLSSIPDKVDSFAARVSHPADWVFLQPAILDQMHDSIIVTDLDGIVTGCNRASCQIYGYAKDELIGKSVTILYPKEDRHLLQEQVIPTVISTGFFRGEQRNRTRSGDSIYVHLSISLLRDGEDKPAGMVGFSVNVTHQKLGDLAILRHDDVQRQLSAERTENDLMRLLFAAVEKAEDVFLITEAEPIDQPGPRIVYVNQAFEKMTGYTADEVVGKTPRILQGPRTDRAALDRIRTALSSWKPVREEMTNYRKDGSEFTVDLSIVPIADEKGWYTHWMAIQRDTTEKSKILKAIEQNETRLHFLTESIPQLLWTAKKDGSCEFVSESYARFLGVEPSACLGQGWYQFTHPDDISRAVEVWKESIEQKHTFVVEYRLRRYDGEYIWFLHRAVPRISDTGETLEWIGSSTDIEQQKRSEAAIRQTEKLAAVGRLASSISHEINNPLASVTNLLYLLGSQASLTKTAQEYVRTAQEELARVSEITTQTLRFHNQSTLPAPTRISEVLDSLLSFYRPKLASAGVTVRREYERTEQLNCLAGDIRQALSNLIGNAIDASSKGGRLRIRLRPSVTWKYRKHRGVRITIADTGHGIPKETLHRIFEPFYTTKGISGTGLGLWITKDLIAKHEGRISMRSSTGADSHGTVISILLPFELKRPL
ncbi:PAS domain S-box [Terriglobus roseus DSM 18391]|uniref:histidine kinase n=1 Tax=Terriglobus roseus (strain DSM 18391 / NRRL B-41598 / KBS 63) TaxID=926566 RepID=I3ZK26_TERRK|nr:PAS domain S-box [Terriglobus roseus DSM 18391]